MDTIRLLNEQERMDGFIKKFSYPKQYYRDLNGFFYTKGVRSIINDFTCHMLMTEIMVANFPNVLAPYQEWEYIRIFNAEKEPLEEFALTAKNANCEYLAMKQVKHNDFKALQLKIVFYNETFFLSTEYQNQ